MKKKTIFLAVLFLSMSWLGQAQLTPDDSCNSAFEDISTSGTALGLFDDGEANITLPFSFVLDGVSSSDLRVGNNGAVLFNTTTGQVYAGNSAPSVQGFYAYYDDIDDEYGDVYWEVFGAAPERYVVIQWNDRPHYNNSASGVTFEMILYETSNEVKFIYQDLDFGAGNSNNDAASAYIVIVGANGSNTYSSNTALPAGVTCIHWTIPSVVNPIATFTVAPDCANNRYAVDVNVTDLGGAASVTVSDNQGNSSQLLAAGPVVMGPYPSGTTVDFTVTNDDDGTYTVDGTTVYYCPPSNDDCDAPIALTVNSDYNCGIVTSATTLGATASAQADDVTGTPNNDVWFSFVATNSEHAISLSNVVAVLGSGYSSTDMGMGLYDGSAGCASLTLVDDSDPNSFNASGLTVGTTYLLRVYGWSSSTSYAQTFDVCVGTPPPPPANDDCENATPLTVNADLSCAVTTAGTTVSATDSPQPDDVVGTPNKDVWFSFVAENTAHKIELSNVTAVVGSSVNMAMAVYDASAGCSSLTKIDDSDPNSFEVSGLTVGTTYLLRVYGYYNGGSAQADFDVCIGTTPPPPSNNDCANAEALTVYAPSDLAGNEVSGDTTYATDSGLRSSCDAYGPNLDLYYSFTVPDGQTEVAIVTGGAQGALSEIALYDACGGSEISCVSVWGGIDEKVFSDLTPGATYILQLWHDGGTTANQGAFTIGVIAPLNDNCDRAKEMQVSDVTCNHSVIGNNTAATDSGVADPECSYYSGGDLWYSVEVPASGRLTFETSEVAGSEVTDTGLAVYSGVCGSLVEIACNDDIGYPNYFSSVRLADLTAGETLFVRVFIFDNDEQGDFSLCIYETPPPPVNDDCANATALDLYSFSQSVGHETNADTTYGTDSGAHPSCDTSGTNIDMFYTFLLPPGETGIRILTAGDHGSSIKAAIYDSCGGAQVACEGASSLKVINGLTGGQQYTLQVWVDEGSSQGEFTIALEKLPTPPDNNVCSGAWNLAVYPAGGSVGNETNGNTQYATDSGIAPSCASGSVQDYFYSFTVPAGVTDVTVKTEGAKGKKLGIAIYDSCGGSEVICEEGSYFHILHGLTSGNTYTLQAWHSSSDKGEFSIALEVADIPVNDDCANAKIVNSLPYINTMDASYATGMDLVCTNGMNDGVWYQFTGDGSDITIVATPNGWDNEIAVYTGACGSLACEARKDVHGSGSAETLTFTSVAGTVYLMDIGHYTKWSDKPEGPFTVEITSEATAISDTTIDGFNYYPNPVNNTLNLSAQNDIQNIMIYDLTGKEVMNIEPNTLETQVDMTRLNSGIYFVKVRINNQITAFKVVKK